MNNYCLDCAAVWYSTTGHGGHCVDCHSTNVDTELALAQQITQQLTGSTEHAQKLAPALNIQECILGNVPGINISQWSSEPVPMPGEVERCPVTGHPCGTDTWNLDHPPNCPCGIATRKGSNPTIDPYNGEGE